MEEKKLTGQIPEEFNLEHQFTLYLKRVKLDVHKMPTNQFLELRRAFMGGIGQLLVLLYRDGVAAYNKDDAQILVQNLWEQTGNFWIKETAQ